MIMLAMALAAAAHPPSRAADPLLGRWMNRKETVAVAIDWCGPAYCGRVTWAGPAAKEAAAAGGTPQLVGTMLMRGFRPAGRGTWKGEVFVPDLGQTAQAEMALVGPGEIEINGCQFGGLLCKSQVWHRAPARR